MHIKKTDLLPQCFYEHLSTRPNEPYLTQPIGGGEVITHTFSKVMDEAARMTAYLRSLDLEPASKIAIVSKNCAHFIISELAIWMAGHVSVPLYPTLAADTIRYILEHSESKLLFVGKLDSLAEVEKGVPEGLPCIAYSLAPPTSYPKWDEVIANYEPVEDFPEREATDTALIIYTSGSTGLPKGVLLNFGAMAQATVGVVREYKMGPNERMLSYLPLAHVMDKLTAECPSLYSGFQVFFAEALDTFVADMKRARPTVFISVPRLWLKFQMGVFKKMPPKKLDRLLKIPILSGIVRKKVLTGLGLEATRFAISGSAPIPAELLAWYRKLGLELLEAYGMTENFAYSHASRLGEGRVGFVGHPQAGVECKLSEEGEVLVKSPASMDGYYKQPELTKESFTDDGFLKTGDRGEIDPSGRLRLTGRVKDLFKTSKGKYVAPVPIENRLNNDEHIELCCVVGSGRPTTCALVQLGEAIRDRAASQAGRQEITVALERLLNEVNGELAEWERLSAIVVTADVWGIETGELTPTMKIKRNVIEERYAPVLDDWYGQRARVIWQ